MPIRTQELYKHMFDEIRFVSELRLKILGSWGVVYAALAAAFAWVHHEAPVLDWVVTLLAACFTVVFWLADCRNRPAIRASKEIGAAIETDPLSGVPEDRRFFASTERAEKEGTSHSLIISLFGLVMVLSLVGATLYLLCTYGELP